MSLSGNGCAPSTPKLCMQTIKEYALDKLTKVNAIGLIFASFYESEEYFNAPSIEIDTTLATILPCLTNIMPPNKSQLTMEPDMYKSQTQSMKTKSLLQRMELKDPELSPLCQGSPKKQALNETLFPCLISESTKDMFFTTSQELTRKMVQNHSLNYKPTKLKVLRTK